MQKLTPKLSLFGCAISLFLSGSALAKNPLFEALPLSPLAAIEPQSWDSKYSQQYQSSGSDWTVEYDESVVFQAQLSHQQHLKNCQSNCQPKPEQSYQLRIGKGGQIYSLRGDSIGEAMPPQFRRDAKNKFGKSWAPWIDEVLQIVSVNTKFNTDDRYFMHGSGIYLKDQILDQPFYNPTLASGQGRQDNSYVSINWAQQAHVPTPWRSHAIYYNQYRDVGNGVIEVTSMVYNYAEQALNYFNFPWGGARTTTFGQYIFTKPDGSYYHDTTYPKFNQAARKNYNQSGGWMAYSQGKDSDSLAMALVLGHDQQPRPSFQTRQSSFRYGYSGGKAKSDPTAWRNYQVGAGIRVFNVEPGQGVWVRWYIALGKLGEIKQLVDDQKLAQLADYGMLDFKAETAQKIAWYLDGNQVSKEKIANNTTTSKPSFYTFAQPVNGSLPLFKVTDRTGREFVTTNPYQLANSVDNGKGEMIKKSYDGHTTKWQLMGYVLPTSLAGKQAKSLGQFRYLESLLSSDIYLRDKSAVSIAVL